MDRGKIIQKIDIFLVDLMSKTYYFLKYLNPIYWGVRNRMKKMPREGHDENIFIILNGPSLKSQDLTKLKGENLMFVNRGFLHPLYGELQPKYHVFVDSKLRDGVWPISWIDEIFELNPHIKIIFPLLWYNHPRFKTYQKDPRILWLYWQLPFYNLGVSGGCFSFAINHKFKNIYFTGFDADSCAHDMLKSSGSHFYGIDPELGHMTSVQHANAMFSTFLHFTDLNRLSLYCKKHNINIYNLTNGGLLDMFPRRDFNNLKLR